MNSTTRDRAPSSAARAPRVGRIGSDLQLSTITLLLRLPQVMAPLGVLTWLAVSASSAWAAALGAAALCLGMAVCGLGMAVFATVRWRLWALAAISVIQGIVMWQLSRVDVSAVSTTWDAAGQFAPFFVAGLSLAPMGLAARLRWASVFAGEERPGAFGAAMRRESVNEALATVLGAALTGLLAVLAGPSSVLRASAILSVLIMLLFVLHPSARQPQANMPVHLWRQDHWPTRAQRRTAFRLRHGVLYGIAALNALLGAAQGCLAVYSVSLDTVESMGVMYALLGFGAAVGSTLAVRFRHRVTAANMWVLVATGALLTSMLLSGPSGALGYALVLMAVGFFSGPCLLCIHSCAGQVDMARGYLGLVALMNIATGAATAVGLIVCAYLGVRWDYMSAAMIPVAAAMALLGSALVFCYGLRRTPGPDPRI
ncbi:MULTISPECIES: hypothetical protein [Kocuria]|uniref:hypothetical protein n=1 Tax=Kocuria TaxID=57493 RepID=UPI00073D914A|nr:MULTISPECIES: hypothetical protein [Kocuria]MBK4119594.1 hypothetical protein [Kocuria rhizophila]